MKKIVLLVITILFLLNGIAFATIHVEKDSFNGDIAILSDNQTKELKTFNLIRTIPVNAASFSGMSLSCIDNKWMFFDNTLEIKCDDKIYTSKSVDTKSHIISSTIPLLYTTGLYIFTPEIENALKNAKEVTIRVNFTNQPSYIYNLNQSCLEEWKQVLNYKVEETKPLN